MLGSTIENHTHNDTLYNCTHAQAWAIGWVISRWSIWNVLQLFRPPVLASVAIVPKNKDLVDPTDTFELSMFHKGGTFENTPLNHYLRLQRRGSKHYFFVNAGFLLNQFILGPRNGFSILKELINLAEKELATYDNASEESFDIIQEAGGGQ